LSPFTSPPPGSSFGGGPSWDFMGGSGTDYGGSASRRSRSSSRRSSHGGGSISSSSIDYTGLHNMYDGSPFGTPVGSVNGESRRSSLSGGGSIPPGYDTSAYMGGIYGPGRWRRSAGPSPDPGLGGGIFAPNYTPDSFASGSTSFMSSAYGGMPSYGLGPDDPTRERSSRSKKPMAAFSGFGSNRTPGTYGEPKSYKRPRAPSSSGSDREGGRYHRRR
jgi:hypothetical protein